MSNEALALLMVGLVLGFLSGRKAYKRKAHIYLYQGSADGYSPVIVAQSYESKENAMNMVVARYDISKDRITIQYMGRGEEALLSGGMK
ncbi:MAG: hypothetical protein WCX97_05200 [Candidatus Magasanikbacteria bacterium]